MDKTRFSSKSMLITSAIFLAITCGISIFSIVAAILFRANLGLFIMEIISAVIFFFASVALIVFTNRVGCKVWFDNGTNELCRRGLFCGFAFRLNVNEIQDVVVATIPRQAKFIVFIDTENTSMEGLYKKSYVRLEYNAENIAYIQAFWNKPIQG